MLKVPSFLQTTGHCGPASLKMALAYFGVDKSESELAKLSGATRLRGVEGIGLATAAKKLGFDAFIKDNAKISDIKKYLDLKIPVIVDWFSKDDGHYSVVVDMNEKNIYLQDPEIGGIKKLPLETFKRVWFDFPSDLIRSPKDLVIRRMIIVQPRKK